MFCYHPQHVCPPDDYFCFMVGLTMRTAGQSRITLDDCCCVLSQFVSLFVAWILRSIVAARRDTILGVAHLTSGGMVSPM